MAIWIISVFLEMEWFFPKRYHSSHPDLIVKQDSIMGDFIKDLNIIDFLGMLLPGSFYVMASKELFPLEVLLSYLGDDPGPVPRITLLLVVGYVVGTVFHEIGDIAEKILWKFKWFDPRTYAAKNAGLADSNQTEAMNRIRKGDRIYLSVIPGKTDTRKRLLFEGFRTMSRNLLLVLIMLRTYPGIPFLCGEKQKIFYDIACAVLFIRYYHYSYLKYKYSYEDHLPDSLAQK